MNLIDQKPKQLTEDFLKRYSSIFSIDIDKATKLINNARKDYSNAEYQLELERRWYNNGDFTVYNDEYYFTDVWMCFLDYSRRYIKSFIKNIDQNFNSILDLGCGVGYTTAILKQMFPLANVHATNIIGTDQYKFCEQISKEFNFNLYGDINAIESDIDLIFASEYFEHIQNPIGHILDIIEKFEPKYLVIANSFNTKSVGHFKEYSLLSGNIIPQENMSRLFNKTLRENGYTSLKTKIFNNKPRIWKRD
jgi:2-polyprenyl-3-methyl-5-hydroxy-6-metoxy-1,4-benzoquinol methylase